MGEWLNSVRLRLRALFHRRQWERDVADELNFHLAMREDQLRGSGSTDARAGARRRFGSPTKVGEDLRAEWAVAPTMSGFGRDLRYAARTLRRTPGFTIVVILTLAIGIGANTAFFSVVNAVLIRPLGFPDQDRLVSLSEAFGKATAGQLPFSALDYGDLRNDQQSFTGVAAYRNVPLELSGRTVPERITGAKVTHELFSVLGVKPVIGRTFTADDDRPGVNVAVVSWSLWQRHLGSNPSIDREPIQLDRQPYTVIGVMPAGFAFPRRGLAFNGEPADVWIPIAFTERERAERGAMHANNVVGRLKDRVSIEQARAELDVLSEQIASRYPPAVINAGFKPHIFLAPLHQDISGKFETPLLLLLAAVGLVLLVACVNVANLILSRVASRGREFAVRTALGARQGQLVQLLFCEALLLSFAGGIIGVAIAIWLVKAAPAVLTDTIPGMHNLAVDIRVLGFTALVCLATAFIFAIAALPGLDRRRPSESLRDDASRATSSARKLRLQRGFVVLTVSLASVLLVGAGLFIRSFATLMATDVGFRAAHVLTVSMTLPRTFYTTAASVRSFYESLERELGALPGVRSVALATDLPLSTYELRTFTPEGPTHPDASTPITNLTWVQGPYFETLGISLVKGRFFEADEHHEVRRVVIVNEKLAARAWPGQDAVGKRLRWGGPGSEAPWLTVVGVIRDVTDGPVGAVPNVHAYEPYRQLPDGFLNGAATQAGRDLKTAILADGDPAALTQMVRQRIARLDSQLAIENIESMEEKVREVVAPQQFSTMLVGSFAAIALLLATVGLYGLLAYTTTQRQREIAVRVALGAERGAVVGMVIAQGAKLVFIGLTIGLLASIALTRLVTSQLYQANPYDAFAFVLIPAVLVPAALVACALPAWRAARVDPSAALRAG